MLQNYFCKSAREKNENLTSPDENHYFKQIFVYFNHQFNFFKKYILLRIMVSIWILKMLKRWYRKWRLVNRLMSYKWIVYVIIVMCICDANMWSQNFYIGFEKPIHHQMTIAQLPSTFLPLWYLELPLWLHELLWRRKIERVINCEKLGLESLQKWR